MSPKANQEREKWEVQFDEDEDLQIYDGCDEKALADRIKDFIRTQRQNAVSEFVERVKARLVDGEALLSIDRILEEEFKSLPL